MLDKNLNVLKKRFPELADRIQRTGPMETQIEVTQSKSGPPVAAIKRDQRHLYLNSPYDPELEARRWVEANFESKSDFCILCGAGFFYHVKAVIKAKLFKKVVVYEPDIEILRACFQVLDLTEVLQDINLGIVCGRDYDSCAKGALVFYGGNIFFSNINIQSKPLPSYLELYSEEIQSFLDKIRELMKLYQLNLTTLDAFAKNWLGNTFQTFPNALSSPVLRHYFNQFKNVPAILVSAGPSLEKNIHQLEAIKENAVIICAGSSIRAMNRKGIHPHMLVALDYGEVNSQVYDDLDLSDVYLVYNCRFWHVSATKFKGKRILYRAESEGIPEILLAQNRGKEIGTLSSGFSVSHTALDLAFQMGCNPIILIGQDLSYAGVKRYAEGQVAATIEYFEQESVKRRSFITKDIYGNDVLTDYELDSFRVVFEKMIDSNYKDKVEIINATEGGLHIGGTVDRKFSEVIRDYCGSNQQISSRISALYEQGLHENKDHPVDIVAACSKLKAKMERGSLALADLIERTQALRKQNFQSEPLELKKLEPILNKIRSDYDRALVDKEYHQLLLDFQSSSLSVLKAMSDRFDEITTKDEYDGKIQIYLNIIINTKRALDYIVDCMMDFIKGYHSSGQGESSASAGAGDNNIGILAQQIRAAKDLQFIGRQVDTALNNPNLPNRSGYLFLSGLILWKKGDIGRALSRLEEAVRENSNLAEAYFLIFRIQRQKRNQTAAMEALLNCRRLNYREKYCLKTQVKVNYRNGDYIETNNLIHDYLKKYPNHKGLLLMKVECLRRVELHLEAERLYQVYIQKYHYPQNLIRKYQSLPADDPLSEYRGRYEKNRQYFQKRGIEDLPEYGRTRYQMCRFLKGEFVYDCQSGEFFSGVNHIPKIDFSFTEKDIPVIFNTHNTLVFDLLPKIFHKLDYEEYRKQIEITPVLIIEQEPEQWNLIIQLFDFEQLNIFKNVHYLVHLSPEALEEAFLDERAPYPNILYGTDPETFKEFLIRVKEKKDVILQKRLQVLGDYYKDLALEQPKKVLIRTSILDQTEMVYARELKNSLQSRGIDCVIATEEAPYYKWTLYQDVKFLDDIRPDLVISLLGAREPLETYRRLGIPLINWILSEKELPEEETLQVGNEKFWLTGNLEIEKKLVRKGVSGELISKVPLPVIIPPEGSKRQDALEPSGDIGLFGDLGNLEEMVNSFETIFFGFMIAKDFLANRQDIVAAIKAVYVSMYLGLNNEGFQFHGVADYEAKIKDNFWRRGLKLGQEQIRMVAPLMKREFEKLFFTMLQAKWAITDLKEYQVAIYGNGWELDPVFEPFHRGNFNSLDDREGFQKGLLRNKVNVMLRLPLPNNSYFQPDLINGCAGGGFLIVSDVLVRELGTQVVEPFQGMLETFGSREEMVEKIKYYIHHPEERIQRSRRLQEHIQQYFSFRQLLDLMVPGLKENH